MFERDYKIIFIHLKSIFNSFLLLISIDLFESSTPYLYPASIFHQRRYPSINIKQDLTSYSLLSLSQAICESYGHHQPNSQPPLAIPKYHHQYSHPLRYLLSMFPPPCIHRNLLPHNQRDLHPNPYSLHFHLTHSTFSSRSSLSDRKIYSTPDILHASLQCYISSSSLEPYHWPRDQFPVYATYQHGSSQRKA